MPTPDREPCPVEVPIVREKHIGFRFNKPGRGTLFVRPRNFQPWLTPASLAYVKAHESEEERLDRQDVMVAFAGGKPIKSFRK